MKISICMATYNGDKYIKEQLESILCQLGTNDEVIISDDSSTDKTVKIIKSLKGLHLTESMLREILEMLHLLRIRKGGISAGDIPQMDNADMVRAHLKKKTHPILSSLQKKLRTIRDAMALPPGVDIKVDPFFEKEYIDILLKIGKEEDIGAALAIISDLAKAGHMRSILELTKGRVR